MPFQTTPLPGLLVFEPRVFGDERGYFFEAYNEQVFQEVDAAACFVQDNQAASSRGVLRGLHFQAGEAAQAKLVRVVSGEVYDVTVDIRPTSPTYLQWYGLYLSGDNHRQLYIPRGYAHGYVVTSKEAIFLYKCDNFYAPEAEGGLRYDDPAIGVEWPEVEGGYHIVERDLAWPGL
ncbi:dTDP-4-dehydrorhamnose 3,5-epimerase [Neolewinella maritima]|uniref:dTDP-4-dehydrorhamnose 3,5-epimerase n=1 Tax=Neolewinella maritima TaxID=1383882 RepID=A0ABM9AXF5_9BACT|nr:dTDP-4-dehydrorhamnose 3,5-epimerase [Neolewinella maritima]CAH0998943.1 dTDP-4-dehydrorhamnose 3,5-epimerase [Neolewinella maritima]